MDRPVGLYHDNGLGLVAYGYDVRGAFLRHGDTNGNDTNESLTTLEAGVRFAVTPHVLPIKPYVEALGGYGGLTAGQGTARTSASPLHVPVSRWCGLYLLPRAWTGG